MNNYGEFEIVSNRGTSGSLTLVMKRKYQQKVDWSIEEPKYNRDKLCNKTMQNSFVSNSTAMDFHLSDIQLEKNYQKTPFFLTHENTLQTDKNELNSFGCSDRPDLSYEALIQMAFADMGGRGKIKGLRVSEITSWIRRKFPYFTALKYFTQCITHRLMSSDIFKKYKIGGKTLWTCFENKPLKSSADVEKIYKPSSVLNVKRQLEPKKNETYRLQRIRKKPDFFSVQWNKKRQKRRRMSSTETSSEDMSSSKSDEDNNYETMNHLEYLQNLNAVVQPYSPDTESLSLKKLETNPEKSIKEYCNCCDTDTPKSSLFEYLCLEPSQLCVDHHRNPYDNQDEDLPCRRSLSYDKHATNPFRKEESNGSFLGPPDLDIVSDFETNDEESQNLPTSLFEFTTLATPVHQNDFLKTNKSDTSKSKIYFDLSNDDSSCSKVDFLPCQFDPITNIGANAETSKQKSQIHVPHDVPNNKSRKRPRKNKQSMPTSPALPTIQSIFSIRNEQKNMFCFGIQESDNHTIKCDRHIKEEINCFKTSWGDSCVDSADSSVLTSSSVMSPYYIEPADTSNIQKQDCARLENFSMPTWTRDVKQSIMTAVVPAYCYIYPIPVLEGFCINNYNVYYEDFGHRIYKSQLYQYGPGKESDYE